MGAASFMKGRPMLAPADAEELAIFRESTRRFIGREIPTPLAGGYGYMSEYPVSTMWTDARLQKIYDSTNEIMKELISCSL
jgi:hypothetical protein